MTNIENIPSSSDFRLEIRKIQESYENAPDSFFETPDRDNLAFMNQRLLDVLKIQEMYAPFTDSFIAKISGGKFVSTIHPKQPRTILMCFHTIAGKIEVTYFFKDGDVTNQNEIKLAYDALKNGAPTPGNNWLQYASGSGVRLKFGDRPARVYFLMLVEGWEFATLRQDAITSKLPVSNYYDQYAIVDDPQYIRYICSIYNHGPFEADHDYNVHCLVEIGGEKVPVIVDPKFENP